MLQGVKNSGRRRRKQRFAGGTRFWHPRRVRKFRRGPRSDAGQQVGERLVLLRTRDHQCVSERQATDVGLKRPGFLGGSFTCIAPYFRGWPARPR
jgi:hypothetical protein